MASASREAATRTFAAISCTPVWSRGAPGRLARPVQPVQPVQPREERRPRQSGRRTRAMHAVPPRCAVRGGQRTPRGWAPRPRALRARRRSRPRSPSAEPGWTASQAAPMAAATTIAADASTTAASGRRGSRRETRRGALCRARAIQRPPTLGSTTKDQEHRAAASQSHLSHSAPHPKAISGLWRPVCEVSPRMSVGHHTLDTRPACVCPACHSTNGSSRQPSARRSRSTPANSEIR